ncbi:ABC transporter permease [Alicyclobacillus mengziensis]|uniref:ABC transporter permease n=1 Tax=Alicyclobacillus mengziensis TaxID=2931921 RepID=A0A9X7Z912_9BACL|nr:ABC transporter permease [Alicyclobacillus mengziensis]QSO48871.1 ABC transporter permease [Alicyclobacillus mengziensis]
MGLRAAFHIMRNDLRLNLVAPFATLLSLIVPINFLFLFVLFAVGGAKVPVGVVMSGHGTYDASFLHALQSALTFHIHNVPSSAAGQGLIQRHQSVATIQIPRGFSTAIKNHQSTSIPLTLNNLNADFADDVRRAMPLAILNFYHNVFPSAIPFDWQEVDTYAHNVTFLGYLSVSIQTVALLIGGLLFGGRGAAREWELGTMKELMLAPIPSWSVVLGKLAAGMVNGIASAALIFLVLLLLGLRPLFWAQFLAVTLVTLFVFISLGVAIGSIAKSQFIVTPFAFALGLPLFFISGAFGPISWSTPAAAAIARVFPVAYANAAFQHAVHGYWPIDTTPVWLWSILLGWAAFALAASWLAYHRAAAKH